MRRLENRVIRALVCPSSRATRSCRGRRFSGSVSPVVKFVTVTGAAQIRGADGDQLREDAVIADWDTNTLFLSDLLETRYPDLVARLRSVVIPNGVPIEIIPSTCDIWCRDFMPIQLDENRFCKFVYKPDYLNRKRYRDLITPADRCRLPFMANYHSDPIKLDGGNVVASRTRVILTNKVFKENSAFDAIARHHLRERLEELFEADCIFIRKEPYDYVGHADGVVRFVTDDRVLVNDYSGVDPGYGEHVRKVLEGKGLEVETLPLFTDEARPRPSDLPSAVGLYINYLRVGNVVVIPGYGRPEDQIAMQKVEQTIRGATVFQVPCRKLAKKGGVLNCASWTIKACAPDQE
jgi:agmatine deiminase